MSKRIIDLDVAAAAEADSYVAVDHEAWPLAKRVNVADLLSTSVRQVVSQMNHGFAVGNALRHTGTASGYVRALANTTSTAAAIGIVSRVLDVNTFEIVTSGFVSGLSGLTAGSVHYVHPSVSGNLTTVAPIIRKELLFALSGTTGFVMTSAVQDLRPPTFMSVTTPIRNLSGEATTEFTQTIPSLRFFGSTVSVSGLALGNSIRVSFYGDTTYTGAQYVGSFTPVLFQDLSQGWLYRDHTHTNMLHIKVENLGPSAVSNYTITVEGEPL